jgi:hypothetical protein
MLFHTCSYSITPIVVFDGSRRVSAKARELERRLNARQLLAGRAETVSRTPFARLNNDIDIDLHIYRKKPEV